LGKGREGGGEREKAAVREEESGDAIPHEPYYYYLVFNSPSY